jgi:quercetin dioxygenase-like cupin family protein
MATKPIIVGANGGTHLNVLGDGIEVVIHGRDTGGTMSMVIASGDPGKGPPPHVHSREDETFHVLAGEIEGFCGAKTFRLTVGMSAFLPRNIPHAWKVAGKTPGRVLVILTPAGFEGFFEEVGALTPEQQQNIPAVIELGKKYGLDFLPPK